MATLGPLAAFNTLQVKKVDPTTTWLSSGASVSINPSLPSIAQVSSTHAFVNLRPVDPWTSSNPLPHLHSLVALLNFSTPSFLNHKFLSPPGFLNPSLFPKYIEVHDNYIPLGRERGGGCGRGRAGGGHSRWKRNGGGEVIFRGAAGGGIQCEVLPRCSCTDPPNAAASWCRPQWPGWIASASAGLFPVFRYSCPFSHAAPPPSAFMVCATTCNSPIRPLLHCPSLTRPREPVHACMHTGLTERKRGGNNSKRFNIAP